MLEVGCGTGAATVPLAEAVGGTGEVVGIDISEPMLAAARGRISQSGLRNITLLRADAQVHAFEPNRFDLIASRFGWTGGLYFGSLMVFIGMLTWLAVDPGKKIGSA